MLNTLLAKAQDPTNPSKQYIPNITTASPQVAAMSKVGEIPIDISTGRINYTIPIFEIQEGNFTMPINLSYNYSGLLFDETPGHAGVGWTFNIGGSILHTVNGLDDYHHEQDKKIIDDYLNVKPPYDKNSSNGVNRISELLKRISDGYIDGEPDKYSINIGNINSSFYLDKNGNPVFLKNENYKITRTQNDGFILVDDQGINYVFDLIISADKGQGDNSYGYASGYLVTEINFPNTSNKIIFQYENANLLNENYINETLIKTLDQYGNPNSSGSLETNETTIAINNINLKKIVSDKYSIEIKYKYNPIESGICVINSLIVKNNENKEIKNFVFSYSGWVGRRSNLLSVSCNGAITNQMEYDMAVNYPIFQDIYDSYFKKDLWGYYNSKALRATNATDPFFNPSIKPDFASVKIGSLKKITYQTKGYSLIDYEPNMAAFGGVPYGLPYHPDAAIYSNYSARTSYLSGGTDEKTFVVNTVPCYIDLNYNLVNNTVDKEPYERESRISLFLDEKEDDPIFIENKSWYWDQKWSDPKMSKSGTKKQILISKVGTYHLKATSTLGINASIQIKVVEYPDFFDEPVGGIRVKQVQNCDYNGKCITTVYNFTQNGKSTGLMLQKPKFYSGSFTDDRRECLGGVYNKSEFYTFNSVYPLSEYRGSPVLYKKVEKYNIFGSNTNGKTVSSYLGKNVVTPNEGQLLNIGLLDSEIVKDQSNNVLSKSKSNYLLDKSPDPSKYVYSLEAKYILETRWQNSPTTGGACVYSIPIPLNSFREGGMTHRARNYKLQKEENKSYFKGDSIVQTTEYNYNLSSGFLKSQKSTNSKRETLETKYLYAQDYEMASESVRNELIAKNMIGILLDTRSYNGVKLSEQKTEYTKTADNLLLPKFVYAKKGVGDIVNIIDKKITYDQYDNKGNILQYTPESGSPVAIIWGYNQTQPIAKIENATYAQAIVQYAIDENVFRNNLPNAMITTYTYIPLVGIKTITDPKGQTTTYEYDEFNRLKLVKDAQGNILSENQYHYKN
ncbi:RHS repeat domain-containing protein [Flavobacterium sp. ZT3R18]|uniref:RHS repeat domain-containing protein n=1 Tax=Flavobacterium sp. ZT3R18 TaxID=2594429 RepID=UPI00163DDEDE|nr:RHS repeat domain-containing protein [Flavobacterium sp. ZT3R18]